MTEVRRHQRRTASGKVTTVRRHERDTGGGPVDDPYRPAPYVGGPAAPEAAPAPRESWWDEEGEPVAGDWWAEEPEPEPVTEFAAMQQQMREWRAREIEVRPVQPDTSPMGRALGLDTPEGAAKFARLRAYREAGYDGPLDSENRIPDPDDPAERPALEALAHMRSLHG